jgi:type II secretory pathway component GspD/PulD (secretin)
MPCSRRNFLLLTALATGVTSLPYRAHTGEREAHLYELRHRFADEFLPLARDLMGERGSATLHPGGNAILLVGAPEDVARTLSILLMQDRPLNSIVVRYAMKRLSGLEAAGVEIRWKVDAGSTRIGNIVPPPEGDAFAMKLHGEWRQRLFESGSHLRLLGGSTSRIETGTALPYQSGGRHGSTTYVTASTGFVSNARVMGDGRVRLAIDSLLSSFGGEGIIRSTSAETILELEPGEIAVLGGIGEAAKAGSSSLAHRSARGAERDELVMLISVEITN